MNRCSIMFWVKAVWLAVALAVTGGPAVAMPPLPDFVVESLDVGSETIVQGRPLAVTAVVKNQGSAAGDARHLDVWYHWTNDVAPAFGDVGDSWARVGRLEAGESRTVVLPPQTLDHAGTNRFCARIEFENLVSESINTNNHFCLDYVAVPARCAVDFDGDAASDLALFHAAKGDWYTRRALLGGETVAENIGRSAGIPVPADYDGDRHADRALYNPTNGTWSILASATGSLREVQWEWNDAAPVPGDYDGDGMADIAGFRTSQGIWIIHPSSDPGITNSISFGWASVVPVSADYDGDGKTDIAVYYPKGGMWYIRRSSDGVTEEIPWGWSETVPTPSDYDGDGKADISVFHRAEGTWYIRKSSSPSDSLVQPFGWSSTVPVPADYDGDGKTDVAVYYPEGGMWYILGSKTGQTLQVNFGWKDAKPVLLAPVLHDWYKLP